MPDPSRLDKLEAAVRELRKMTKPQAIREALVLTDDPRGYADWTRVVDDTGLIAGPPRRTLHFPGATITDDPTATDRGATVVTISGGGTVSYEFSDDTTIAANEKIGFVAQSGPANDHMVLTGVTIGTTRVGLLMLGEDLSSPIFAPSVPNAVLSLIEDSAVGSSTAQFSAAPSAGGIGASVAANGAPTAATTDVLAGSTFGGPGYTRVLGQVSTGVGSQSTVVSYNSDTGSVATMVVRAENTDNSAATTIESVGATGGETLLRTEDTGAGTESELSVREDDVRVTSGGQTLTLLAATNLSNFGQVAPDTTAAPPVTRITRGPFTATPGSLAAGAAGFAVVNDALAGTSQAVMGAVNGAAGDELALWSWVAGPGAGQITLNFTNTHTGAIFPTVQFVTFCDA